MAQLDRAGPMRLPVALPSFASMYTSSRSVCQLYDTRLRETSPS